jgi:purine-binding chemotaxis protein CheW
MENLPAAAQTGGNVAGSRERGLVAGGVGAADNEYLSFAIDSQYYGIDLLSVREIRAWTEVTHLPNTPDFVRGIINLRGTVVPIYDLRVRLGGGRTTPSRMHVVIVVVAVNGTFGLLVDSVSDILSIDRRDLQGVPETNMAVGDRFLSAIVAREERMVSIIDLDRLVSGETAAAMAEITAGQAPA